MLYTEQGTLIVTTASWSMSAGNFGGVRRSTNDGDTWQNPLDGYNGRTLCLGKNGVVFAAFWPHPLTEALYRSTNDGVNWTRLQSVSITDNIFSIAVKNNNNMVFIGTRNGIRRSTNSGLNFTFVNTGIPNDTWVRDLGIDTANNIILAATTNGVFSSTNDGDNWQMATGINPQDTIVTVTIDNHLNTTDEIGNGSSAFWGSSQGNIYESDQNTIYLGMAFIALLAPEGEIARTYIAVLSGLNRFRHGVAVFPKTGNINDNGGFFLSSDGQNFKKQNQGLPLQTKPSALTANITNQRGESSEVNFFLGSFGSDSTGAKIYKITYIVGIEQISTEIPDGYGLKQNYPNPFNPSTKIEFDIPQNSGMVKLIVYNSLGKVVSILVNNDLQPGSYEYTFDGDGLTSGVYFYKLESKNFSQTKKMLLIK
jgi:hypothetical protein